MRSKLLCCFSVAVFFAASPQAAEPEKFLGAQSCNSSSCHGGASPASNQNLIWSQHDFHTRTFATLTTARSERMAEALNIKSAAKEDRCTVCHAPFAGVPKEIRSETIHVSDGVSCENCHGPAEKWIRSHTRKDFRHEDRVAAGVRDLKNLYVRANTCVACHQNVSAELRAAGHPELNFELDGQCVTEPKHWREEKNFSGAQAWLVGQAVALRELSWQLSREKSLDENLLNRWRGLIWLLARSTAAEKSLPALPESNFRPSEENFALVKKWSDDAAKAAARISWTPELSRNVLTALANTSVDFGEVGISQIQHARRAERLVLALDRLTLAAFGKGTLDEELNRLFKLVQSLPDFDPAEFAKALAEFSEKVKR